jgi:anti-sigma factor ChrR (cupin superfamily)
MEPQQPINANMSQRVVMDSAAMTWQPSPSGTVWRKRLHLVGKVESGQVTSIVRYQKGSSFPAHEHPEGEEILVLEGTFSDEHGDWPAGTYLLNPEGFRHTPFSRAGCVLFVKLRQYAGPGRHHVALDINTLPWESGPLPGIDMKTLYADPSFPDTTRLERWAPGITLGPQVRTGGVEILVLDGSFVDEHGTYKKGMWLRLPSGAQHQPASPEGCLIYVKADALPALRSTTAGAD